MVYVDINRCRCGNQMFRYAVARYVQLKSGDKDLVLDYSKIFDMHAEKDDYVESLADYKTVPYRHYDKQGAAVKNDANPIQRVIGHFKCKYMEKYRNRSRQEIADRCRVGQKLCNMFGIFYIEEGITKLYARKRKGNSFIIGVCETPAIYEIKEVLQRELEPKKELLPQNIDLYNSIINSESVCVSVRRGDFFNDINKAAYGVCTEKYYIDAQKAMDLKLKGNKNVKYFVFSDDIGWCKEHLRLHDMNFAEQDNMPTYEAMRLMYSCKHFIISNSTFSWWGQFLCKNENKIVVSPSRWNNEGYDSVLIDKKNWILIDV